MVIFRIVLDRSNTCDLSVSLSRNVINIKIMVLLCRCVCCAVV